MSRTPPPPTDAPTAPLARAKAAQPPHGPPAPTGAPTVPHARAQAAQPPHGPPAPPAAGAAPLFVPRLATEPEPCSDCGALLAADQRYCLACGERRGSLRVPFPAAPAPAPAPASATAPAVPVARARPRALPQSALSALYGMAGAAALGLGLLAGALIVQANDDPPAPQPLAAATAQPTATAAAPATTPPPAPTVEATFSPDWPAGQTGWTVQLQTLPKDGTTPDAVATAKADATANGAADVGVLDSDSFPTLDGGQYVIYSGVASSKQDAEAARDGLIANFPDASVVEIADRPAEEPVTESQEDLKEKEDRQTPEDAQKNTRKAPPTVESEGTPPPADDKEPGAGSDATEIG